MKIIIVGLGKSGMLLAGKISGEGHDIQVIDERQSLVDYATNHLKVSGICSSGTSKKVLLKAGADLADIIIALTPSDEVNLMSVMIAKDCGTRYGAVKLNNRDFAEDTDYLKKQFSVDYVVNAKLATANEIERYIGMNGSVRVHAFFTEHTVYVQIPVDTFSTLRSMKVSEFQKLIDEDVIIGTVRREGHLFIPDADFSLRQGDVIGVVVADMAASKLMEKLGGKKANAKRIMLVGGGTVCAYLAETLVGQHKEVTVLDDDHARCVALSKKLPEANIAHAPLITAEVLDEEGIKSMDVCISIGDEEDKNMIVSMYAWSVGVPSIITIIQDPAYEQILDKVDFDTTISPSVICVDKLVGFIRNVTVHCDKSNGIRRVFRLEKGLGEAIEFVVGADFKKANIRFASKEFKLIKDAKIAVIMRGAETIIPNGDACLKEGDRVIIIAKAGHGIRALNDVVK